jgi:hypothetical protein
VPEHALAATSLRDGGDELLTCSLWTSKPFLTSDARLLDHAMTIQGG